MKSPPSRQTRFLRTPRLWIGVCGLIFLTAFWLSSATFFAEFGHNRSRGDWQSLHVSSRWLGIGDGCLLLTWRTSEEYLGVSNDPPPTWDYRFVREPGELTFFPPLFLRDEPSLGEEPFHSIIFPLWLLPFLWILLCWWRIVRIARKEREALAGVA